MSRFLCKNLDQKLDQNEQKTAALFFKAKRGLNSRVVLYYLYYLVVSNNNGRKQKRDADFTETATEKKTFMLHSLVFDFGSARVEESIA